MSTNIRSTLAPYFHKKRKKWYPRGTWPVLKEDGTIERKRDFNGTGSDTRGACQAECDRLNAHYEQAARQGPKEQTFEEAVLTYLSTGGDGRFFHDRLLNAIGHYRVNEITDDVMRRVRDEVYPNAVPATVNRQLFTPVITVLHQAAKGKAWKPDLTRPKGALKLKPAKSPADDWYVRLRSASAKNVTGKRIWALLLLLSLHGRRPSDGFRNVPSDFDAKAGTLIIDKDKSGNPILVRLAPVVVEAILDTPWQDGPGLFGHYTFKNRRNAYRRLKKLCEQAEAPYFTFHKAGRHKFAKRLLEMGYSTTHVTQAGRWADPRMVSQLYGHLAQNEVDDATRDTAERWAQSLHKGAVVTPFPKKGGAAG